MNIRLGYILTIIKKELWQQFTSLSNFLVFGAVMAVVLFLFLGDFYRIAVSSVGGLFALFPWILVFIVPAVTMGSIAGERRAKTFSYLLAQPVTLVEIVIAKILSAGIFIGLFILATAIVPISLNSIASFDVGIILAGYGAAILLVMYMVALDLFVSSLMSNHLSAFIVAAMANIILIFIGIGFLEPYVPDFAYGILNQFSPVLHFNRFSSGFITVADVGYFIISISGFVWLLILRIKALRQSDSFKFWQTLPSFNNLGLIAVISMIFFVQVAPGSIDITEDKLFTLSDGARNILQEIDGTVQMEVFISDGLPPAFKPQIEDINRLIDQIDRDGGESVEVTRTDPMGNEELQQELAQYGVYPQVFTVPSQSELQAKEGYMAIRMTFGEEVAIIPQIDSTSNLEFQLMSNVYGLVKVVKPAIGILDEGGESNASKVSIVAEQLSQAYTVKPIIVDLETPFTAESLDVDTLLVVGLTQELSEENIEVIKSRVKQGMSLVVFDTGVEMIQESLYAIADSSSKANALITDFGISINQDMVYDVENGEIVPFQTAQGSVFASYPFWPTVKVNTGVSLLERIDAISMVWSSSLSITDEQIVPIAETSRFGGLVTENFDLAPNRDFSSDNLESRTIAAYNPKTETRGAVVVVGSSQFALDDFISGGGNQLLFITQLIELGAQSTDLASIRIKNRIPSAIVFEEESQKDTYYYAQLIGIPMLLVGAGVVVQILRRRKMKQVFTETVQ